MTPPLPQTADPVDEIVGRCHRPFAEAWAEIAERVQPVLLTAVTAAAEALHEVSEQAGFDKGALPASDERTDRLVGYRKGVAGRVLSPLLIGLQGGPVAGMAKALRSAEARAISGVRNLPASALIPWEAGAFEPAASDTAGRRFKKVLARSFSGGNTGRAREVPLRALAADHLRQVLLPAQVTATTRVLQITIGWVTAIENAWGEWSDSALPVLMSAERTEAPGEGEQDLAWAEVEAANAALSAAFGELIGRIASTSLTVDSDLDAVESDLRSRVRAAGGFVYSPTIAGRLSASEPMEELLDAAGEWDAQSLARLELNESLLDVLSGGNSARGRLGGRLRIRLVEPARELSATADRLDALVAEVSSGHGHKNLGEFLDQIEARAKAEIEAVTEAIPDPVTVEGFVRTAADGTIESLQGMIRQVPASLELHPQGALWLPGKRPETRTVPLQEMARQAFDALRVERIRAATLSVTAQLQQACADAGELPSVVAFGFEAARKDLEPNEEGDPGDAPDAAAGTDAVDLVVEALSRAATALRAYPENLDAALQSSRGAIAVEITQACESLFGRAGARRTRAQLLAAQSRLSEFRVRLNAYMAPRVDRATRLARIQWTGLSRTTRHSYRQVASLFGGEATTQALSTRTIRTIAAAETGDVPLVYQKLFSTEPISDPTLLAGRDAAMTDAMSRWARWRSGQGTPTIFVGRPGSGVTSFVNVLVEKIKGTEAKAATVSLPGRMTSEAELVAAIAVALELEDPGTFDDLVVAILSAEDGALPSAVGVDTLEHVYLRSASGTDLFERLLTFMSETDTQIFWFGGITTSAWQVLCKSEPTAVSQVETVSLQPLSAADLKTAVTLRHRRSGLQVVFQEPSESSRSLRQWVRRLRGRQGRQDLMEADFFDQLHRASLGTLRLALFQWVAVADFHSGDGQVRMGRIERPDFSTLDTLDLTQSFSLKAFLEHRTLTLAEHDEVFRLPRQESYQVFESLANRQLIEVVGGRFPKRPEIEAGIRYRVRPLLEGAVISHLERRNIVH